jgi:hypothetical protein
MLANGLLILGLLVGVLLTIMGTVVWLGSLADECENPVHDPQPDAGGAAAPEGGLVRFGPPQLWRGR